MTANNYSTAPIWRRLAALIYDCFILLALSFIYSAIATAIATQVGYSAADYRPMFNGVLFPLGWAGSLVGFYCFFWRRSGQTIGMRTWHIKVVKEADEKSTPSWKQCFIRASIAAPSVLFLGAGYIFAMFQSARKTPQDLVSDTRIILVK